MLSSKVCWVCESRSTRQRSPIRSIPDHSSNQRVGELEPFAIWIALSAKGHRIHGTPDPEAVSKRASHGCIRLTNWDALELAKHVSKSTRVSIERGAGHDRRVGWS